MDEPISENPSAAEWTAARGRKWLAQLDGMEAMLAPVDNPLIEALRLDAPYRIADIGCGSGATTMQVLRRAPRGSVVHGFDISPDLIQLARSRRPAHDPAAFETGDMSTAPPPETLYDRLASRFGVMFFDDPPAAFANLFRWLKPGGRFAFAVWGPPTDNPWLTTVRQVVTEIIDLPKPDLKAPGPFRYGESDPFLAILGAAGFGELAVRSWRGVLPIGGELSPADAAKFALASFASFGEQLEKAGKEAVRRAHETLTERFSAHHLNGAVRLNATVNVVTGSRRK